MQNQHVVGEPDLDSKDQCLKKQEGLRISLEKIGVGYVFGESQNCRYPDNEKHSFRRKGKNIMPGEPQPYWEQGTEVRKEVLREQELGEGLNEWELSEHSGLTSEEQELSRLKNTSEHSGLSEQELSRLNNITPKSVFNIVAWIIVILLAIVGMVLLSVFHFL